MYYELGYAHGVGNTRHTTLLVAREGTKLHFDVAGMRMQFYKSSIHLKKLAKSSLANMIKVSQG